MSFRRNLINSLLFCQIELERGKFMCISRFVIGCVDILKIILKENENKIFDDNHEKLNL